MGIYLSKKLSATCLGLLMTASFVSSDFILDDFNDGNGESALQSYWYFYTDAGNKGTSTVENVAINPPFVGFYEGKDGTFGVQLNFKLGDSTGMEDGVKPYVAFETEFIQGGTIDFTGVEKIRFDVKGSASVKKIQFCVPTSDVADYNYFQKVVDVSEVWTTQEILFKKDLTLGLRQEPWGTPASFNPANIQKFLLKVRKNENTSLTTGTLWIDNIVLVGNAKELKRYGQIDTVSPGKFTGGALLSNFDDELPATLNSLGYYWYSYTDESIQGTSAITRGITDGFLMADQTGGISGGALSVSFVLGNKIVDNAGNTILPFVGVGTELGTASKPYNAFKAGASGIYVDYKSDGLFIDVEVEDYNPRPNGVVWFSKLPPTNNAWKGATINFSQLTLTSWAKDIDPIDKMNLLKINFKISDEAIKEGSFSIDNVYLVGATGVISPLRNFATKGITASQNNRILTISFDSPEYMSGTTLSLFNSLGKVVTSSTIAAGQRSCSIPLHNATGMYVLRVMSKKGTVRTAPLHISR